MYSERNENWALLNKNQTCTQNESILSFEQRLSDHYLTRIMHDNRSEAK